jgi:lysophospholipase L1-like esterase
MPDKKQIMAFGDSLTWGASPGGLGRHRYEDRWTSVVEAMLQAVRIVPEGLSGRTTSFDDHSAMAQRNGVKILPTLLGSHYPLDLVTLMLGTNDLKPHICGTVLGAAAGITRLIEIVRTYPYGYQAQSPAILIISPPHFGLTATGDRTPAGGRSITESMKLAEAYNSIARKSGCAFFDAATVACASELDGVHLDGPNTRAIGLAVAPIIAQLLDL